MSRKAKPKPSPAADDDNDFADDLPGDIDDDGDSDGEDIDYEAQLREDLIKARDWRDVERYKEMRELRELVGDDLDDLEL